MMRAIAIPFVGWAPSGDALLVKERIRAVRQALLAALDRLVPPRDPSHQPEPPPEWYRFPPF
jgi:hypothetical protein